MTKNIWFMFIVSMLFVSNYYYIHAHDPSQLSITEHRNKNSMELDFLSALEIVTLMNNEDHTVAAAVTPCLPSISEAIERIAQAFSEGGRLIYLGTGTSGRLAVSDASECMSTFSASPGQVIGIIAGGDKALSTSIKDIEDDGGAVKKDLIHLKVTSKDIICGISASGGATCVTEALKYAKSVGCYTIFVGCNAQAAVGQEVDCFIAAEVGPEILTGSTRLKAGTATKMILNMLSTGAFIRFGKVYKNLMIDVKPLNKKLLNRCHRIISEICGIDEAKAVRLFEQAKRDNKVAVLMHMFDLDCATAQKVLQKHKGLLRDAIKAMRQ